MQTLKYVMNLRRQKYCIPCGVPAVEKSTRRKCCFELLRWFKQGLTWEMTVGLFYIGPQIHRKKSELNVLFAKWSKIILSPWQAAHLQCDWSKMEMPNQCFKINQCLNEWGGIYLECSIWTINIHIGLWWLKLGGVHPFLEKGLQTLF